jgi:uncharacterized membrane protein YozB (DUF420 family)
MDIANLSTLNALLNATSGVLLTAGYLMVRRGRIEAHRRCMLAACTASVLFLISYVIYHLNVGSVPYTGQGGARVFYFAVLISHIILAATIVPLAIITVTHALRERFDRHRRIARWTLPIWLYVSVTGIIVYVMLYVL